LCCETQHPQAAVHLIFIVETSSATLSKTPHSIYSGSGSKFGSESDVRALTKVHVQAPPQAVTAQNIARLD